MDIFKAVKNLLGAKPVEIGELNRRATRDFSPKKLERSFRKALKNIQIIPEYQKIHQLLDEGNPVVFVTGNAGTGKSTLILYLRNGLKKNIVVVAPTGVAAFNAGGVTIHSFFRFPPKMLENGDIKSVYDRKLYQKLDILIKEKLGSALDIG